MSYVDDVLVGIKWLVLSLNVQAFKLLLLSLAVVTLALLPMGK